MTTFGIGNSDFDYISGVKDQARSSPNQPIKQLSNLHGRGDCFTQIVTTKYIAFGIDSNEDLWTWGYPSNEKDNDLLYDFQNGSTERPCRFRFFRDKNLRILELAAGYRAAIVKA